MPDITVGRLRGGYCVSWRCGGKRRRYQLEARTLKDAEAEAISVYRQKTLEAKPKGATVAEIWNAYRADLAGRPTGETMGYTGKAILPHFGALQPDMIDKARCQGYASLRKDAGKKQGTIWTELGHLRSALVWAADNGWIESAPKVWRPIKPESDKRILNRGEARKLIESAEAQHIRLALVLLLGTAARVGALLELTWDRVDFERGSINLRVEGAESRKGRAIVPMNSMTRAALSVAHDAALSDHVIEYNMKPVKAIKTGVSSAVRRAALGRVTIHELRHTAAVTMLSAGVPLEKVSQMLGHSNTAITFRTYARYLPEHMQDAADVLDFTSLKRAQGS